jgi:phosphoserine phosphatase
MDSTLINIECVDEIADAAGRKTEVAAITEAAMRGEIADYKASLRQRVRLLAGVTVAQMQQVLDARLQLNPARQSWCVACQAEGLKTLLVSGGFSICHRRSARPPAHRLDALQCARKSQAARSPDA